jgi:hypothetical protein
LDGKRWFTFDDGGGGVAWATASSSARMSKPVFIVTFAFPACRGTVFAGNWGLVAFDMSSSACTQKRSAAIAIVVSERGQLTDMFDIPRGIVV